MSLNIGINEPVGNYSRPEKMAKPVRTRINIGGRGGDGKASVGVFRTIVIAPRSSASPVAE